MTNKRIYGLILALIACVLAAQTTAKPQAGQPASAFKAPDAIDFRAASIMSEGVRMHAELFSLKSLASKQLPTIIQAHGWGGTAAGFRRDAIDLANRYPEVVQAIAMQHVPALEAAQRACELDPSSAVACRIAAELALQMARPADALHVLQALSADAPRDHDYFNALGNALFQTGDPRQAVTANLARVGVKVQLEAESKAIWFPKVLRRGHRLRTPAGFSVVQRSCHLSSTQAEQYCSLSCDAVGALVAPLAVNPAAGC